MNNIDPIKLQGGKLMNIEENLVLIVEDNVMQAKIVKTIFKTLGYAADHTIDGNEAVKLVKEKHYKAIYMDIGLSTISGDETCKLIREYERQNHLESIPIVAVTANTNPEELKHYKELGMNDAISKPVTIEKAKHILSFCKD